MSICFGIYLGNSNCCIAVNRDGKTSVVANAGGERVTPSIVTFQETEVVTGVPAKQALMRHSNSTVAGALRALGSSSLEDLVFPLNMKCSLTWEKRKPKYNILVNEKPKQVSPDEILKNIFVFLKDIAQSHLKDGKLPVVLTLPLWMTGSALSTVHQAACQSGFQVLATISQPAAACLSYGLLENKESDDLVLILHCGGTSVIVTIAEISSGLMSIRETTFSVLGGDSITTVLQNHFAKEFFNKYKGDPFENKRSTRKLYSVSENCKHVLSTMSTSPVHAESLWEGVDFSTQLSRARFDGIVSSTLNEFLVPIKDVLQRANITNSQINKVILSGGTCKIPKLQQIITDMFPSAEILKNIPGDELLALGASKEAKFYMEGKKMPVQGSKPLITALVKPIYVKVRDSKPEHLVFPKGTPTHSRNSVSVNCTKDSSTVIVYEGKSLNGKVLEDQILAQMELNSGPNTWKMDFTAKSDGSLLAKLTDSTSKVCKVFTILADSS